MALVNPNIALGIRQPEFTPRNAMAEYAQMQQIMNAQDTQQMNALKMQEARDVMTERNALRQLNPSASDFEDQLFRVNPTLGIQYRKERSAAEASAAAAAASRAAAAQSEFALKNARRKFGEDLQRGLSANPSNDNILRFGKSAVAQGLYSEEEVGATVSQLLAMPLAERVRVLSQAGASPSELKPTINVGPTGLVRTSAFGGDATVVPGTGAAFQMTPAQIAQNAIAQQQLGVSQGNLRVAQDKFALEQKYPGFEFKEDGDGNLFAINKRTLQAVPVTVGGAAPAAAVAAPAAAGPGMPGPRVAAPDAAAVPGTQFRGKTGSLTESQGNATAYGMRMREANEILEPLEKAGKTNTGLIKGVVGGTVGLIPLIGDKLEDVSGSVFNALPQVLGGLSPAQQKVAQARINFITAILRKESGAAIGRDEFATAEKNYFPKPGDDDAAIAQKQQARRTAIKAMEIQAGPGARQMGGAGGVPSAGGLPGATANNPLALPIPGR